MPTFKADPQFDVFYAFVFLVGGFLFCYHPNGMLVITWPVLREKRLVCFTVGFKFMFVEIMIRLMSCQIFLIIIPTFVVALVLLIFRNVLSKWASLLLVCLVQGCTLALLWYCVYWTSSAGHASYPGSTPKLLYYGGTWYGQFTTISTVTTLMWTATASTAAVAAILLAYYCIPNHKRCATISSYILFVANGLCASFLATPDFISVCTFTYNVVLSLIGATWVLSGFFEYENTLISRGVNGNLLHTLARRLYLVFFTALGVWWTLLVVSTYMVAIQVDLSRSSFLYLVYRLHPDGAVVYHPAPAVGVLVLLSIVCITLTRYGAAKLSILVVTIIPLFSLAFLTWKLGFGLWMLQRYLVLISLGDMYSVNTCSCLTVLLLAAVVTVASLLVVMAYLTDLSLVEFRLLAALLQVVVAGLLIWFTVTNSIIALIGGMCAVFCTGLLGFYFYLQILAAASDMLSWRAYYLALRLSVRIDRRPSDVVVWLVGFVNLLAVYCFGQLHGLGFYGFKACSQMGVGGQWLGLSVGGFDLVLEVSPLGSLLWLLTLWLFNAAFAVSWNCFACGGGKFWIVLFVAEVSSFIVFNSGTLMAFYVGFELASVCLLVLLLKWGSRHRRLAASLVFFTYTLFGSACMLGGMSILYLSYGSLDLADLIVATGAAAGVDRLIGLSVCLWCFGVLVKLPAVPVHSWLLRAHVEAPTSGSVVLAGVFLKFGGFAVVKFVYPLLGFIAEFVHLISLFLLAGVFASLVGFVRTVDLKETVAYSSILHMNISLLCLLNGGKYAAVGAQFSWLAHGFIAAGLFILVGHIYEVSGTRHRVLGGIDPSSTPDTAVFSCYFIWSNAGLPGGACFPGEFLMLLGLVDVGAYTLTGLLLVVQIVITLSSLLFLQSLFATPLMQGTSTIKTDLPVDVFCVLVFLVVPSLWLGLFGAEVIEFLSYGLG